MLSKNKLHLITYNNKFILKIYEFTKEQESTFAERLPNIF